MSDGGVKIIQAALDEWKSMSKDERRLAIREAIAKTTEIQRVRKERCATHDHPPRYDDVFFDAVRAIWRDPLDDSEGRAMTDEEWTDLGKRAVACKHWRWMPGMLLWDTNRVLSVSYTQPSYLIVSCYGGPPARENSASAIPDLRDPATLGCLLALVRGAWEAPHKCVRHDDDYAVSGRPWVVWCPPRWVRGNTEAAALVAALEAAP